MDSLPVEVLEKILCFSNLDYPDIVNISLTSSRLCDISNSNEVWRALFRRRYPILYSKIINHAQAGDLNWKSQFENRFKLGSILDKEILAMSAKFYNLTELSSLDFKSFDNLLLEHNPETSFHHLYTLDHLNSSLQDNKPWENLTYKFYCRKALIHIQHRILTPTVKDFFSRCSTQDTLREVNEEELNDYETALILIAQWCQPDQCIDEHTVLSELDNLAQRVFNKLVADQTIDPSKIRTPAELKKMEKSINLCRSILDCANQQLRNEGFAGNSENYYVPENSFINKVLETKLGIPISLSLMYTSVLARLGILCEPVNFPRHFLLRWLEHPELADEGAQYTYIDVFHAGKRMNKQQALNLLGQDYIFDQDTLRIATPLQAAHRLLKNLISIGASENNLKDSSFSLLMSALKLMVLLNTEQVPDFVFMLSRVYLQLNINHEETATLLGRFSGDQYLSEQVRYLLTTCQMQKVEKDLETNDIIPKKRNPEGNNIRYQVGNVMKHKKYDYKCVIYGWDDHCSASTSWIKQMGVDKLSRQDKQPFFNVLVEDGSSRYAADENLEPCTPTPIPHPHIGKYFKEFCPERGYIPNTENMKEYPDDFF